MEDDLRLAEDTARILGPSSAASKALAERSARLARGENVGIWDYQNRWVVGPLPDPKDG